MQALAFSASLVASTATVDGLAAIPATLLLGRLSDRLGRARLLAGAMALAGLAPTPGACGGGLALLAGSRAVVRGPERQPWAEHGPGV